MARAVLAAVMLGLFFAALDQLAIRDRATSLMLWGATMMIVAVALDDDARRNHDR